MVSFLVLANLQVDAPFVLLCVAFLVVVFAVYWPFFIAYSNQKLLGSDSSFNESHYVPFGEASPSLRILYRVALSSIASLMIVLILKFAFNLEGVSRSYALLVSVVITAVSISTLVSHWASPQLVRGTLIQARASERIILLSSTLGLWLLWLIAFKLLLNNYQHQFSQIILSSVGLLIVVSIFLSYVISRTMTFSKEALKAARPWMALKLEKSELGPAFIQTVALASAAACAAPIARDEIKQYTIALAGFGALMIGIAFYGSIAKFGQAKVDSGTIQKIGLVGGTKLALTILWIGILFTSVFVASELNDGSTKSTAAPLYVLFFGIVATFLWSYMNWRRPTAGIRTSIKDTWPIDIAGIAVFAGSIIVALGSYITNTDYLKSVLVGLIILCVPALIIKPKI